jgi:DNA-binding NtrC family response regulator
MKAKVLLVDSQENTPDSLGEVLRREEYEVSRASNGADALNALRSTGFDLVLLDLQRPVTNAWDALSQIVMTSLSLPVIILTEQTAGHELTSQNGIAAILEKPLDLDLLRQVMDRVLVETAEAQRRRAEAGLSALHQRQNRIHL